MSLLGFCCFVVLAALSGAFFKPGEWYDRLRKPSWNPPKWVFPAVWSVVYLLIAISGWLVWEEVGFGLVIIVWGIQLLLNAAWSWIFFGLKRMDLAFWEVLCLWISIAVYILLALPVSLTASLLFVPYLVWVTIAATLNWTVWKLNTAEVQ